MYNILPAVIGLGYVGLPMFLRLNKKFRTIGFDIDFNRVQTLKNKLDINLEFKKSDLFLKNNSLITNKKNSLKQCNFYIITVPTPIYRDNKPDLRPLNSACEIISKNINDNDIIFIESTVYPGLTEILKKKFFKKKKIWMGYSPERINPGDRKHTLKNITKIVSFESCPKEIKKKILFIYKKISKNIIISNSIQNAEMSKVIENIQRDINIAFMNEILMVCEKLNLNFQEVIKLAKTKWNFLNFSPGLVGGHCLPVDPFYLYDVAQRKGHEAKFMLAGRRVNNELEFFLQNKIIKKIKKNKIKKLLICGISYKANVADARNSLGLNILKSLRKTNIDVEAFDPILNKNSQKKHNIKSKIRNLSKYDLIVVLVKHDIFLKIFKKNKLRNPKKYFDLFDTLS
ncbi:nucleotide sugar dehydrogenase [Pelagibacterales bacterium SAG-MED39]|nr:nucleotide sugar dehydrogenase [Pelagibacterales bacterium SAG-MED39]